MTTDHLTTQGVADLLGVAPRTVNSYRARRAMPEPRACPCCGHFPSWPREVIETWAATRPGRGVGGGRPRKEEA